MDAIAINAYAAKTRSVSLSRAIASGIVIVSEANDFGLVVDERLKEFIAKTLRPINTSHVTETETPKRQSIDDAFTKDNLTLRPTQGRFFKTLWIPDAHMRPRQIKVIHFRCSCSATGSYQG